MSKRGQESARRRGGRRRTRCRTEHTHAGATQPIVSALPPLDYLTTAQIEQLHAATLRILENTGVVFRSPPAVAAFKRAGARVAADRVFLGRDLIASCLATAPAQYTLHARNPAQSVTIGGNTSAVMPGGGPPYVLDLEGVRRPGTLSDLENFTRLSAMAPEVQVAARKAVEAQDVPAAIRHLECWRSLLTLTDKPVQSGYARGGPEAEDALQMLAIVFGGESALDGTPVTHCSVNANSPLLYDRPMLESLLAFARFGQPILISSFVMAGVTGPATLAGSLAQHNAEVLAGIALVQLVRPGTPVLYGTASSNVDLRNAVPASGSPESAISTAVCAQLARYYGLPSRGGGALTDSALPDAQSNYERMFTLLASVLSGTNFLMHALGVLETYLTLSYEQFVLDLELVNMVRAFVQQIEISPETLALDTINAVGPGGFFLEAAHTLRHYRQAHFLPRISLRVPFEQWKSEVGLDAVQRANAQCRQQLESYLQPDIDPHVAGRLHDFVERRKVQLLA